MRKFLLVVLVMFVLWLIVSINLGENYSYNTKQYTNSISANDEAQAQKEINEFVCREYGYRFRAYSFQTLGDNPMRFVAKYIYEHEILSKFFLLEENGGYVEILVVEVTDGSDTLEVLEYKGAGKAFVDKSGDA